MKRQIDAEIQKKNYEKELLLCKKAGGDIERYRRLSFNALQLEQIRKGLESKVDVELFMDPAKSWLEMELIRTSLEAGIDIEKYIEQGFSWTHPTNIRRCVQCVKAWKREFYWHLLLNRDMPENFCLKLDVVSG